MRSKPQSSERANNYIYQHLSYIIVFLGFLSPKFPSKLPASLAQRRPHFYPDPANDSFALRTMQVWHSLLGRSPSASDLSTHLASLHSSTSPTPEVKSYSDAVYFNYYALGLSLLFVPFDGYKPKAGALLSDLDQNKLKLESIDLYNSPSQEEKEAEKSNGPSKKLSNTEYSSYPRYPVLISSSTTPPSQLEITSTTTGKEFVSSLGEPSRKGGGAGPSSGSIGIWCEWDKDGLMVEFGGDEARGPQAWERGKDARWKVITIFKKKGG
jgi:hypothetical protein